MEPIEFCKDCQERIGMDKIRFLYTITTFHELFKTPTFIGVDDSPVSIQTQKVCKELEELGYIVTHEDAGGDLALFPVNIEPKVCGCHLYCKTREGK